MASRYWRVYAKPIQDAIVAAVKQRNAEDAGGAKEVIAGMHGSEGRYADLGIYVLPPRGAPANGDQLTPTEANEWRFDYPVVCNLVGYDEAEALAALGVLSGVVVDAIEEDPLLGGLVEAAWVTEDGAPTVGIGQGPSVGSASKTVTVSCRVTRTAS